MDTVAEFPNPTILGDVKRKAEMVCGHLAAMP